VLLGDKTAERVALLEALRAEHLGRAARDAIRRALVEALDRWELSLFAEEPFRSGQLHDALTALLGGGDGAWAASLRAALLLGEKTAERVELLEALRAEHVARAGRDAIRRALVEVLVHGNRAELVRALDETLLGAPPRPATVLAA